MHIFKERFEFFSASEYTTLKAFPTALAKSRDHEIVRVQKKCPKAVQYTFKIM